MMDEQLKELLKKAFDEGAMYEATFSKAYSFDSFIEDNIEQLRLYGVVSSCVDKDELISDLDDRRAVGVEMDEEMWYFCRKQSAEYLLDKYKLLRK